MLCRLVHSNFRKFSNRHRIVNNLCRSYFEENLHCLTMLTKTPSEWDGIVHSSVNCHRGRSVHGTPVASFDKNNL
ncbi:BolA protein [Trichinella spiralis]|uniref:BolA protein n=1 Tax=Trichinella spiralis TaxID=6334 RepID=UPI0001EFED1E|nr:BolA protein [Trichinella spiralis]